MAIVNIGGVDYHMNDNLQKKWNKIKDGKLKELDEDRVYVTDGRERTGKSVFTIQQIAYIDDTILEDEDNGVALPKIPIGNATSWEEDSPWRREAIRRYNEGTLLPRITFNSRETLKAIRNNRSTTRRTKGILFDEAFRGMSSKGSLSKENKILVQVLMEMGQSNLVLWIVSPSFFLLELYPAMLRSNALFHVKKDKKSTKRVVRIFNYRQKATLYQIGLRKGWGYPIKTKNSVNFYNKYPGGKNFEWRYRLKKQLSLRDNDENDKERENKRKKERDFMIYLIKEALNMSTRETAAFLTEKGLKISHVQVATICKRAKELSEEIKNDEIQDLDEEILPELDEKGENDEF